MISCASVNDRIHSSSSNCFEVGPFSCFKNMSCVSRKNRHSSCKSPVGHLTVRIVESPQQAPPLAGSCDADDCVEIFLPLTCGLQSTHENQFGVRERLDTCLAAALLSHCAPRCLVPSTTPSNPRRLGTLCTGGLPTLRGIRAVVQFLRQSAEPCAAPPTSPSMALLMKPRAAKVQARVPRCSSVCRCTARNKCQLHR